MTDTSFKPFVSPETQMKEFTFKAVLMGSIFGILFGASTVYLALKAGLTVSVPVAVHRERFATLPPRMGHRTPARLPLA